MYSAINSKVDKTTQEQKDASQDTSITNNNITAITPTVDADNNLTVALSKGDGTQLTGSVALPKSGGAQICMAKCVRTSYSYYTLGSESVTIATHSKSYHCYALNTSTSDSDETVTVDYDNSKLTYKLVSTITNTYTDLGVSKYYATGCDYALGTLSNDTFVAAINRLFSFTGKGTFSIGLIKVVYYNSQMLTYNDSNNYITAKVSGTFDGNSLSDISVSIPVYDYDDIDSYTGSTGTATVYHRLYPATCSITPS